MSFSSQIKEELSKINNLTNKEQLKFELIGYLLSVNSTIIKGKIVRYATESEYNINRFAKLLKNLQIEYSIEMEGNSFVITIKSKYISFLEIDKNTNTFIYDINQLSKIDSENKKALVRGAFLGGGSINNPEKTYHFEIVFSSLINAKFVQDILLQSEICMKIYTKNKYSLYLKDGEAISQILAFLGANKGVLDFEEIRVKKQMRGKVNRIVNCETANLNKTINASIEQIEAIKKLKKLNYFHKLNDSLKEIANLRLENPNMSLIELGKSLKNPLGKSGVNYRLKKIVDIAKEVSKNNERKY